MYIDKYITCSDQTLTTGSFTLLLYTVVPQTNNNCSTLYIYVHKTIIFTHTFLEQ